MYVYRLTLIFKPKYNEILSTSERSGTNKLDVIKNPYDNDVKKTTTKLLHNTF